MVAAKHKVSGVWRTGIPQRKGKKFPSEIGQEVSSEGKMKVSEQSKIAMRIAASFGEGRFYNSPVYQNLAAEIICARAETREECAKRAEDKALKLLDWTVSARVLREFASDLREDNSVSEDRS